MILFFKLDGFRLAIPFLSTITVTQVDFDEELHLKEIALTRRSRLNEIQLSAGRNLFFS